MDKNHRDILRSLSTDEKRHLTTLANAPGIWHLAGHLVIVAGFASLNLVLDGGWQIAAMTAQGIAMVFLFTAMHECSHRTAFRTRWINDMVGTMIGFMLFLLPKWFFYFHQDHHKFTQDPDRDPELTSPKPRTLFDYLLYLSGLPVWRDHLLALLRIAGGNQNDIYVPKAAKRAVRREAILFIVLYALLLPILIYMEGLLQFWLVPLLLGQPFLRLYLLAEHGNCEESDNMLFNTRTIITNPLVLFLAWNMPYHTEHHSFPAVPFHRLPQFHKYLRDSHGVICNGYSAFHRQFLDKLKS